MAPHTRSSTVVAVPPGADRIRIVKREARRDFAGVAVGVAVGALLWFLLLAIAQFWS